MTMYLIDKKQCHITCGIFYYRDCAEKKIYNSILAIALITFSACE